MPQGVFVSSGECIDYTPGSAVTAGDVVIQGDLVGIATRPIAAGTTGALAVSGIFDIVKASGTVFTAGQKVYWDASNKVAVTTDGGGTGGGTNNKLIGKAVAAAGSGLTTVRVRLSQ